MLHFFATFLACVQSVLEQHKFCLFKGLILYITLLLQ